MSSRKNGAITNFEELRKFLTLEGKGESRNIEFKGIYDWESLKYKITKALIGMSNLEYGGKVIVGITDNDLGLIGITEKQSKTYKLDNITRFVNEYADPPLEIKLYIFPDNTKKKYFVIFDVFEFSEIPTLCKKDNSDNKLKRNKIYIRPRKTAETADNFTHHDLRELLDLAVDKHYKKQMGFCEKFKEIKKIYDVDREEQFDKEVRDF